MNPARPASVSAARKTTKRRRSIHSRRVRTRASSRKRSSHLDGASMRSEPRGLTKARGTGKPGRPEGAAKNRMAKGREERERDARKRLAEQGAETGRCLFLGDAL